MFDADCFDFLKVVSVWHTPEHMNRDVGRIATVGGTQVYVVPADESTLNWKVHLNTLASDHLIDFAQHNAEGICGQVIFHLLKLDQSCSSKDIVRVAYAAGVRDKSRHSPADALVHRWKLPVKCAEQPQGAILYHIFVYSPQNRPACWRLIAHVGEFSLNGICIRDPVKLEVSVIAIVCVQIR